MTYTVPAPAQEMNEPGYEKLAAVLMRAYNQASRGKGKERHSHGEPFDQQVIQDMANRFGVGALLGQAFKKSEESQRLPHDRAVAELLGAIVYLAAAVIAMEKRERLADAIRASNEQAAADAAREVAAPPERITVPGTSPVLINNRYHSGGFVGNGEQK